MGLFFRNTTNRTVWVTFGYYAPWCPGTDWKKKGWYQVLPGQRVKVWSGWAGYGPQFYFFADDDFGRSWAGPYGTQVPWSAFDWCWDTGQTGARGVGFRQFSVSWYYYDYTINLTT